MIQNRFLAFSASLCLFHPAITFGKQAVLPVVLPRTLLQQSLTVLTSNTKVSDITLSGSVGMTLGSSDESGSAVLRTIATGISRADLTLSSGPRTEIRNLATNPPAGGWSGSDGVSHAIPFHNLISEPNWISPVFQISTVLSNPTYVVTVVGQETKNSRTVYHISFHQTLLNAAGDTQLFEHLTQADIYLDTSTLLPTALDFNIHPDGNAGADIPVEVTYGDYRTVNGVQVPFHFQRYLNGSLFLDLQIDTAVLNSGISGNTFTFQ